MTSGGARNRSGPPRDPNSGRSDALGVSFQRLPAGGYEGDAPDFPLPAASDRESELWSWAWGTPQAVAWAREPWRQHAVAMWVRTAAICESSEATAADKNSLHRFADQIGLTPAGLAQNLWAIAQDEVAARRDEESETSEEVPRPRRLSVVKGA
jgi:hypothetical protein